jgi:hypothetical protein
LPIGFDCNAAYRIGRSIGISSNMSYDPEREAARQCNQAEALRIAKRHQRESARQTTC